VSWSAEQYAAFADERARPARDLLAAFPLSDAHVVVDLGCGPGNSTALIATRFPRARITGLDTSEDMIAAARLRLPSLRFEIADIRTWVDGASSRPADLLFANAVLQWVPGHSQWLRASSTRVEVWRTTYYHALAGTDAIVEWFKGTGLLPFLEPLERAERADYLARYTRALGPAYPAAADGTVLLPFPRLFMVACR
jgi:trans-aconitate 2-methyltransferase